MPVIAVVMGVSAVVAGITAVVRSQRHPVGERSTAEGNSLLCWGSLSRDKGGVLDLDEWPGQLRLRTDWDRLRGG